jgi:hypothetical protein
VRKLVLRMPTSLDSFIAEAGSDVGLGSWSEELQPFYANSFGPSGPSRPCASGPRGTVGTL